MMQSIQSRLKSRRLLGVGEGADGQQHRSKITQILGNDSLTNWQISRAEYPMGLHALQWITLFWFTGIGVVSLFFPQYVLQSYLDEDQAKESSRKLMNINLVLIAAVRMYGAAMLALASLCGIVTLFNGQSRRAIRILLAVKVIFCLAELTASYLSSVHEGEETMSAKPYEQHVVCHVTRVLVCLMSTYYYVRTAPCRQVPVKRSE